jgi:hypothetical protein
MEVNTKRFSGMVKTCSGKLKIYQRQSIARLTMKNKRRKFSFTDPNIP